MKHGLSEFDINLEVENLDTLEIQALTSSQVAAYSAKWAAEKLNRPVIKTDSGLFINCLNGLPGVYTSQFQKQLGPKKIMQLMQDEPDRSAYIRYALAYCEPGKEATVFETGTTGTIAQGIRGEDGMLIDYIFIPDEQKLTMGELRESQPEKREKAWGDAEKQFARWFLQNG